MISLVRQHTSDLTQIGSIVSALPTTTTEISSILTASSLQHPSTHHHFAPPSTMPSGRPKDQSVSRHFNYTARDNDPTKFIATCKRCTDYFGSQNATRQKSHLKKECTGYKAFLAAEKTSGKTQQRLDTVLQRHITKKQQADQCFAAAKETPVMAYVPIR